MKTLEIAVYDYDELSEDAKAKARDWYREGCFDFEWWQSIYEDAANIGLKITSFDLDRNRHAKGQFTENAQTVAANVMQNHGDKCETFKTASQFIADRAKLDPASDNFDDQVEELEAELERSLLEDYSIMLQNESEYISSDEQCAESIRANGYTFTINGKRMG